MKKPVRKPRETFTREFKLEAVRLLNRATNCSSPGDGAGGSSKSAV
jgi:hypothetical protein